MPALVLLAPEPLAGKTTVAAGIARRLISQGKSVAVSRLGNEGNAEADKAFVASLSSIGQTPQVTIAEAPAGKPDAEGKAVVVADAAMVAGDIASFCAPLAGRLAGVVLNRVPQRRVAAVKAAAEEAGIKVVCLLPEDRLLASPTLGDVADALTAEAMFFDSNGERPLDNTLIASISADPGQGYFVRTGANTVIVRSDKPDLQLAALNAGASAMIVTGDLPLLGYVLDRAEEDAIPLLRTKLDTVGAVKTIEALYASRPFGGGREKLERAAELMGEMDLASLLS